MYTLYSPFTVLKPGSILRLLGGHGPTFLADCLATSCGLTQEAPAGCGDRELVFSSCFCSLSLEMAASL